ncbi:MAG: FtsX-like permease family protein [Candidatus Cloacimonetes bacterium]|jgi:putative ABC transport system permease protein|nr:FtsX-like permease family protein [Candidatus Cloacimonadota bacterium]MBT4332184.1 FtsX-like permease family protein [Candidatus Cloacimonadota bacterium]
MFKNYLKIAYRNIIKRKTYSIINIFGLALGLTACILVGLYIWQDFSYDNFHVNRDRLYRLTTHTTDPAGNYSLLQSSARIAPAIKQKFPELDKVTRVYFSSENLLVFDDKKFYEEDVIFADEDFFEMFSYNTIMGNHDEFLKTKNTAVISHNLAQKYFGEESPVGKVIKYNDKLDLEVVGVIEDVPINSHFTFDIVITYSCLINLSKASWLENWHGTFGSFTYVMLHQETNIELFQEKCGIFLTQKKETDSITKHGVELQPIESIHLHSEGDDDVNVHSSIKNVLMLGSIALFILILACINFINLTTSRAIKRAREIGVRKVFGAYKGQLIGQFLGESIMVTFIALGIALVMTELSQTFFEQLIGTELIYNIFSYPIILLIVIVSTLLIGIIAGMYPAFVLTKYQPSRVMKGNIGKSSSGSNLLRRGLVLFQFTISISLIIITIIINQQTSFMRNFDMGFEKDQVLILKTPTRIGRNYDVIKRELELIPGVTATSASLGVPVMDSGYGTFIIPDLANEEHNFNIAIKSIDEDYLDFYEIPLLAGKRLSDMEGGDFRNLTVVNEATVKQLGFASNEEALGNSYTIAFGNRDGRYKPEIIGVVKDFHFKSMKSEVSPLLLMRWQGLFKEVSIKLSSQNIPETMKSIKGVWEELYPEHPFDYIFLNEKIDNLYKAEEKSYRVISFFSSIAIFIACIGLLGLTFYTAEQRRKEIGIRKILGASIPGIVKNISSEFFKLVVIANVIAWPVSYFLVNKWLMNFPYKIEVRIDVFLLGSGLALLISLITIGYTVIRSAASNPIESIRYE